MSEELNPVTETTNTMTVTQKMQVADNPSSDPRGGGNIPRESVPVEN